MSERANPLRAQPRRVRVTRPQAQARRRHTPIVREIDAQTQIGEVYMRSLMRTQLRLALLVLAVVGVLLAGLPLLFAVAPRLADLELLGLPLHWVLLGGLVHPALIAAAWHYCRQAESNERDFSDLVDSRPGGEREPGATPQPDGGPERR